jgi:hypothetical protein
MLHFVPESRATAKAPSAAAAAAFCTQRKQSSV